MSDFQNNIDLFIDTTGPRSLCRLVRSVKSPQPADPLSLVEVDEFKMRVWLLKPSQVLGAPAECLTNTGGSMRFSLKAKPSDTEYLAQTTAFTLVESVEDGDHFEGDVNFNTVKMLAAFAELPSSVNRLECWFDIEVLDAAMKPNTFQNRMSVNREVAAGGEPPEDAVPPYPPSSTIIERLPSPDEKDAMDNANAPDAGNPFATIEDLNTGGAGDAGEVAVFDASGKPVRGSGKTIAADYAFATDDQVMTGADPRAGVKGGVKGTPIATTGGKFVESSGVAFPQGTGDFTYRATWRACPAADIPAGVADVLTFQADGLTVVRYPDNSIGASKDGSGAGMALSAAGAIADGGVYNIAVTRSGSTLTLCIDGVVAATGTGFTHDLGTNKSVPGTNFDWVVCSTLIDFSWTNRALTADEIKACNKGEVPAELARQGVSVPSSGATNGGAYRPAFDTFSNTAGVISATRSTGDNGMILVGRVYAKAGQSLRFVGNVTTTSGLSGFSCQAFRVADGFGFGTGSVLPNAGAFDQSLLAPTDGYYDLSVRDDNGVAGTASDTLTLTVDGSAVGTVAHFPADGVWANGIWEDVFGALLIPGSGITPLRPQSVKPRLTRFREDLAGSVASAGAGPLFTLTDSGAGVLTATPNALIAASLPTANANSEGNDGIVKVVTNTSTGVVTMTNRVSGTPTDAVLQGAIHFTA